mmetsp:Transcript_16724/g.29243  ORF Transcript_16724/g.29243 Transcript_16724/m.29243 type:complete len:358 (+) Transcript_16724:664-1737(+)
MHRVAQIVDDILPLVLSCNGLTFDVRRCVKDFLGDCLLHMGDCSKLLSLCCAVGDSIQGRRWLLGAVGVTPVWHERRSIWKRRCHSRLWDVVLDENLWPLHIHHRGRLVHDCCMYFIQAVNDLLRTVSCEAARGTCRIGCDVDVHIGGAGGVFLTMMAQVLEVDLNVRIYDFRIHRLRRRGCQCDWRGDVPHWTVICLSSRKCISSRLHGISSCLERICSFAHMACVPLRFLYWDLLDWLRGLWRHGQRLPGHVREDGGRRSRCWGALKVDVSCRRGKWSRRWRRRKGSCRGHGRCCLNEHWSWRRYHTKVWRGCGNHGNDVLSRLPRQFWETLKLISKSCRCGIDGSSVLHTWREW